MLNFRIKQDSLPALVDFEYLGDERKRAIEEMLYHWQHKKIIQKLDESLYQLNFVAFSYSKWENKNIRIVKNYNMYSGGLGNGTIINIDGKNFTIVLIKFNQGKYCNLLIKIWLLRIYEIDNAGNNNFYMSFVWCEKFSEKINRQKLIEEMQTESIVNTSSFSQSSFLSSLLEQSPVINLTRQNPENYDSQLNDLQTKCNDLLTKYDNLQNQYNNLQIQHNDLQNQHNNLQNQHNNLQNQHNDLQNQHNNLVDQLLIIPQIIYPREFYVNKSYNASLFCPDYYSLNNN